MGDSAPAPSRPVIRGSREGQDAVAGRSDDRLIKEAVGLVVAPQERLDPPPQLRIGRALTIQHGGAGRRLVAFDGREEHGLNTLRVEWHRMILESNARSREGDPPGEPSSRSARTEPCTPRIAVGDLVSA